MSCTVGECMDVSRCAWRVGRRSRLREIFRSAVAASAALFACMASAQAPHAQEPGPPAPTFRIEAIVEGVSPATGLADTVYGMTAYIGSERTRVDLDIPGTEDAYLLVDNDTGIGWAIGKEQDGAMPVNVDAYRELVLDPQAMCAGMRARCQPIGQRDIAGIRAQGMRYSGARAAGPGGSDRGQMWIDPASGLVLGYDGRTRDRQVRRMRATDVQRQELPDAMFELPAALGRN